MGVVAAYSGGSVPELHGIPYYALLRVTKTTSINFKRTVCRSCWVYIKKADDCQEGCNKKIHY